MTIKALIVDDSQIVRTRLRQELSRAIGIEVVGAAPDPFVARDMIIDLSPDVIILDMEMPRMDGLTFLRKLMSSRPIPTIIVSSLTPKGCELAITCLEAGAVEVLPKPGGDYTIGMLSRDLVRAIRLAASAQVQPTRHAAETPKLTGAAPIDARTPKVVTIGTSTGGTEALCRILEPLPTNVPGIVIVQHMPPVFTESFAQRLDSLSALDVTEARNGDRVEPGRAFIAPGGRHVQLEGTPGHYVIKVSDGPKVCRHRPSVEVLFDSVARTAGAEALGILMTGMGDDGATALGTMLQRGAHTIAQDEATSVVYGMPREAVRRGSAVESVSLGQIPQRILDFGQGSLGRQAG